MAAALNFSRRILGWKVSPSVLGCWDHVAEYAHGTKGWAEISRGRIENGAAWHFCGRISNPYQVEHDVLMDAVRNNRPHNEAEYAAMATMTAILGRMASYSGQTVTWQQAINSSLCLAPSRVALDAAPPVLPDASGRYPAAMPGVTRCL